MRNAMDFERQLTAWLEEAAMRREPDHLIDEVLVRTSRTRRRPGWLIPERWLLMQTTMRLAVVPRMAPYLALLLLILALLAAVLIAGSQPNLPPPFGLARTGLVAFDANGDIYVANPDGTSRHAITTGPANDSNAVWSLDGTRVAFWRRTGDSGPQDLVVAAPDGADVRVVASGIDIAPASAAAIAWSPDGRSIAYTRTIGQYTQVELANVNGGKPRVVTDPTLDAQDASWQPPNGAHIAFRAGRDGTQGVYLANPDGSDVRRLTALAGSGYAFSAPQWSPDGRHVVYYTGKDGAHDIAVIAADGTNEQRIATDPADEYWPVWSPKGDTIAFERQHVDGSIDIVTVDSNGRNEQTVAVSKGFSASAPWFSPDGKAVFVYVGSSDRGNYAIQLIPLDGSPRVTLDATGSAGIGGWQRRAP
jgi:Tol biopolymer transport system component